MINLSSDDRRKLSRLESYHRRAAGALRKVQHRYHSRQQQGARTYLRLRDEGAELATELLELLGVCARDLR